MTARTSASPPRPDDPKGGVAGTQLDLFGLDARAERLVGGLTCIRDAVPQALEMIVHLEFWLSGSNRGVSNSDQWAYSIREEGLRFARTADWRGYPHAPGPLITWNELAEQIANDPRRAELAAWSGSLTAADAWKDLSRPHELWPHPETWHPSYIEHDHARPGWTERITAWRQLYALLDDAIARLEGVAA